MFITDKPSKKIFRYCIFLVLICFVLLPVVSVNAQTLPKVQDPLNLSGDAKSGLFELVGRIIKAIMGVLGAVALAVLFYGGFVLLTSSGRPDWLKKGWEVLRYGIIGIAFIFGSYTFLNFILKGLSGSAGLPTSEQTQAAQQAQTACLQGCVTDASQQAAQLADLKQAALDYCRELGCLGEDEENCREECNLCLATFQDGLSQKIKERCSQVIKPPDQCVISLTFNQATADSQDLVKQLCPLAARKADCTATCETTMKNGCLLECDSAMRELDVPSTLWTDFWQWLLTTEAERPTDASLQQMQSLRCASSQQPTQKGNICEGCWDVENQDFKDQVANGQNGWEKVSWRACSGEGQCWRCTAEQGGCADWVGQECKAGTKTAKAALCDTCCQNFVDQECPKSIPPNCIQTLNSSQWQSVMNTSCPKTSDAYKSGCKGNCEKVTDFSLDKKCYAECTGYFKTAILSEWNRLAFCEKTCCASGTASEIKQCCPLTINADAPVQCVNYGQVPAGSQDLACTFGINWKNTIKNIASCQLPANLCRESCEITVDKNCDYRCLSYYRNLIGGTDDQPTKDHCAQCCSTNNKNILKNAKCVSPLINPAELKCSFDAWSEFFTTNEVCKNYTKVE